MPIYRNNRSLKEAGMDGMILKEAWLDGKQIWSAVPPFVPRVVTAWVSQTSQNFTSNWSGDLEIVVRRNNPTRFSVPITSSISLADRVRGPEVWAPGEVIPANTGFYPAPSQSHRVAHFTEVQQEG